ncbi:MAG: thermonuclease family protein [Candidatus Shapirobacteria bacterium]
MMKRGLGKYIVIVLLALSAFTVNYWLVDQVQRNQNPQKEASEHEEFLVIRVIDGDTILLENGQVIRYLGVDTPEINHCFAKEATQENQELVLGKLVKLEKDITQKDDYGRLLRYVWVNNQMINQILLNNGFGKKLLIPPDLKYRDLFSSAQEYAQENNLGLWEKCAN